MKLFYHPRAPNPRRVQIFLAEKGVRVPLEEVDIGNGGTKTPAFAKMNPFLRIPVLELDDGIYLSESTAICRYFEALHPDPPLFGVDVRDRAFVEMWDRRMEHYLFYPAAMAVRHIAPGMAALERPQIAAWGEANRARVLSSLALLDERLGATDFIAGPRLTVADITALVAVDFLRVIRMRAPPDLIHLQRWHTHMHARPSVAD